VPISARRSLGYGAAVLGGKLFCNVHKKSVQICDMEKAAALEGRHNWQNAAAAYAAVQSIGIDTKTIGKAILSFGGLAHRMETVGKLRKVRFVNDSKATNADAARQALASYDKVYWIAGGEPKAGGIEPLLDLMPNVSKAYLIGKAAPKFHKALNKANVENKVSGTLEMALVCATKDALESGAKNPIVLLSPACASFDQFKNFEIRGDVFRSNVQDLINLFAGDIGGNAPTDSHESAA